MPENITELIRDMRESQIRMEGNLNAYMSTNDIKLESLRTECRAEYANLDRRLTQVEEDKRKMNNTLWTELLKYGLLALGFYFGMKGMK